MYVRANRRYGGITEHYQVRFPIPIPSVRFQSSERVRHPPSQAPVIPRGLCGSSPRKAHPPGAGIPGLTAAAWLGSTHRTLLP